MSHHVAQTFVKNVHNTIIYHTFHFYFLRDPVTNADVCRNKELKIFFIKITCPQKVWQQLKTRELIQGENHYSISKCNRNLLCGLATAIVPLVVWINELCIAFPFNWIKLYFLSFFNYLKIISFLNYITYILG